MGVLSTRRVRSPEPRRRLGPPALDVLADLSFSVTVDPSARQRRAGISNDRVDGRVIGRGQVITVTFSQTPSLVSPPARNLARGVADQLDRAGLIVRLAGPDDSIVAELGHQVRSPLWQLPLTRSRFIRLRSIRAGIRSLRGPKLLVAALPSNDAFGPR